ncbi:MAG: N-acetylmuramic acid 6-phosphate etherase [Rhodobacteraceae bacterium]|nr:N-acetylmuramic acid 6-phosphate etherase [Paracoccaceae bacterium]
MTALTTEALHADARGLDARPLPEIARALADGQCAAAASVAAAIPAICGAAAAMAHSLRLGGRLIYAAAGSSGLMAAADAHELGQTFSIPAARIRILMAGGLPSGVEMPGATEDDTSAVSRDLADADQRDSVIAVSASGTTPYTLAAARTAKAGGATVIAVANNPGAPLFDLADHAICLATPPELVAGSTRMGAGTAQKIALNMLSTLMAVELGHIHDGMMVNVVADNIKLRARASGIVATIAHVSREAADAALAAAAGRVKPAVLLASGVPSAAEADRILGQSEDNLRAALARL